MIENMRTKNETVNGNFSLDPQGVLQKRMQDHRKECKALIILKALQNYVLCESDNRPGHNGKARL